LHDPSLKKLKFFLGDGGWGAIKIKAHRGAKRDATARLQQWLHSP